MNRRGAGLVFCFISTILFISRYISAAIWGSNVLSWSSELYSNMLNYIGNKLTILSVISLIIGIIYLIAAEITDNDNIQNNSIDIDEKNE